MIVIPSREANLTVRRRLGQVLGHDVLVYREIKIVTERRGRHPHIQVPRHWRAEAMCVEQAWGLQALRQPENCAEGTRLVAFVPLPTGTSGGSGWGILRRPVSGLASREEDVRRKRDQMAALNCASDAKHESKLHDEARPG